MVSLQPQIVNKKRKDLTYEAPSTHVRGGRQEDPGKDSSRRQMSPGSKETYYVVTSRMVLHMWGRCNHNNVATTL
eukprot:scaffold240_cov369-Pavlova_lutheri.AAC.8